MKECILRALNSSMVLGDLLDEERASLEKADEVKLDKLAGEKELVIAKITEDLKVIKASENKLDKDTIVLKEKLKKVTQKNDKKNKINRNIIVGLISSNRELMSLITGRGKNTIYTKSGVGTSKARSNIAKA